MAKTTSSASARLQIMNHHLKLIQADNVLISLSLKNKQNPPNKQKPFISYFCGQTHAKQIFDLHVGYSVATGHSGVSR